MLVFDQRAANALAKESIRVLSRLGGYSSSPPNIEVQMALGILLTEPLAALLRNEDPEELLLALSENVEKCNKVWNVGMRLELLAFIKDVTGKRPSGSLENDLAIVTNFSFTCTRDEILIGGVYVRIFVKNAVISDVENPSHFCKEILRFLNACLEEIDNGSTTDSGIAAVRVPAVVMEALNILVSSKLHLIQDIVDSEENVAVLFRLLDVRLKLEVLDPLCQLMKRLCSSSEFVISATKRCSSCAWRLIRFLCLCSGPPSADAWQATDGFVATVEGLDAFIDAQGILYMLGIAFGTLGYCHAFAHRTKALGMLSKLMWNPLKGSVAASILRKFIPEPLVRLMKGRALDHIIKVFDGVSETPELIWTNTMKDELRNAINSILSVESDVHSGFGHPIALSPDYAVMYKQLKEEMYIGDVYIRLYLKQRTYRLTNPVHFLEQLVVVWERSFDNQVPSNPTYDADSNRDAGTEIVLGNEDFLSLLTSCMICVISIEEYILDHLTSWGLDHRLIEFLKRALDSERRGVPMICVLRLLKEFVGSNDALLHLVRNSDRRLMLSLLKESMKGDPLDSSKLHKDAVLVAEVLKIMFQTATNEVLDLIIEDAVEVQLPEFILNCVLSANVDYVRNPQALRIFCVDTLKAMCVAGDSGSRVQILLGEHKGWARYKSQNHDLFLKVNSYLSTS